MCTHQRVNRLHSGNIKSYFFEAGLGVGKRTKVQVDPKISLVPGKATLETTKDMLWRTASKTATDPMKKDLSREQNNDQNNNRNNSKTTVRTCSK
jgi:hypothetical protein